MARRAALPARSFAINEMLRRYQAQLDSAFDFRALVLPVGSRPDADAPADRLGRADGLCARRWRPGRARDLLHLPDHARGAARLGAAELARLSRARPGPTRTGRPMPRCRAPSRRSPTGTSGWRKAGRRARSRRSRSSCPISAAWNATSSAWRATGCCCAPVLSSSPGVAFQNRAGATAAATACMSAIRPSASPTSPGLQGNPRRWHAGRGLPAMSRVRMPAVLDDLRADPDARRTGPSTPSGVSLAGCDRRDLRWVEEPRKQRARPGLAADLGLPRRARRASRFQTGHPVWVACSRAQPPRHRDTRSTSCDFSQIVNHLYGADGMARLQGGNDFDTAYAIPLDRSTRLRFRLNATPTRTAARDGGNIVLRPIADMPPSLERPAGRARHPRRLPAARGHGHRQRRRPAPANPR